jgi:hypothetical protein
MTGQFSQAVDDGARVKLPGNVHPLARAEYDRGEAPSDLRAERMLLVLKRSPERESALLRLIQEQQDRNSPSYHRWLTPDQVGKRFGPSDSDIAAVTEWLRSNGFEVSLVSRSLLFIEFSGTAGQVKQAFGTAIHRIEANEEQHWANIDNPTIPAALAPVVANIDSLNDFQRQAQHVSLAEFTATRGNRLSPSPAYTFIGGTGQENDYAVTPYDFAAIYDVLPLWSAAPTAVNGTGQTIGIVGRSDINPADATFFWSSFGLDGIHAPEPTLVITYNGPNPGLTADESEADIDTQWSGAVAPGATIDLVTSQSTTTTDGVDLSALYIVDNNIAPVMSESYSECEQSLGAGGVQFYDSLWEQAAAQGISVIVSSGDSGAAGCDNPGLPAQLGLQVNGIASTPFNVAVGGTDFNQYQDWSTYWNSTNAPVTQQSAKGYIPETTWNDSCTNSVVQYLTGGSTVAETNCNNPDFASLLISTGGGGGSSSSWLKPGWQTGTPSDSARDLPDVSLFAGNGFLGSYYFVCQSDMAGGNCEGEAYRGFGGTSVSSPQFAGIMALVNQKTGSAQGNPNFVLYKLAAQNPTAFHDVPAGSTIAMPCINSTPNCETVAGDYYGILSGYSTTAGYDLATGLGSVDVANLVNQWESVSFTPSATTLALNGGAAVNVAHGTAVPFSVNVSPSAATGDVALLVAPGTPGNPGIAAFPLASGSVTSATTLLPGGSYRVLAHYGGDSTYGGSYSNAIPVNVSAESSATMPNLITMNVQNVVTSYAASSATYGDGYQLFRVDVGDAAASVSPAGISSQCNSGKENCPTGSVTLSAPSTSLDGMVLPLNSKGFVEVPVPPRNYQLTATYPGDASYAPSVGKANFTIAKAPTIVNASVAGLPVQYGTPEEIAGEINTMSDGVTPGGTFQFFIDGTLIPLGNPVLLEGFPYEGTVNGNTNYATLSGSALASFLSVGNHTFSAQYTGDAYYAAGTSAASPVSVVPATPIFLTYGAGNSDGTPVVVFQSTTASATLDGSQKGVPPTGTITFYDTGSPLAGTVTYTTSTTPGVLYASMPVVFSTPGAHPISASYSGDPNYASATTPIPDQLKVLGPVSVAADAGIVIASPGQSGSTTLKVTANGGFTGTATLTCTPDPGALETGCSLANGSTTAPSVQVNVDGSPINVSMTVTSTAPHSTALLNFPHIGGKFRAALAGILILCVPFFKRRRGLLIGGLVFILFVGLGACGGGRSGGNSGGGTTDPGTPAGAYSFTVSTTTGTGANQVTISTPVNVVIN